MIEEINDIKIIREFVKDFEENEIFSDPMLKKREQFENNLVKSINDKENKVIGIYDNNKNIGLFSFLIINDEKYIEMLVGLSRVKTAYEEVLKYLKNNYKGFQVDFVYNPKLYTK